MKQKNQKANFSRKHHFTGPHFCTPFQQVGQSGCKKNNKSWPFFPVCVFVLVVGLFGGICGSAFGAPITQDQAFRAAKTFITLTYPTFNSGTVKTTRMSGKSARAVQGVRPLVEAGQAIGYIADLDGTGYVLLSTDDEAPPVKCHTEAGSFDRLPPGFLAVLKSELAEDLFVLAQMKTAKGVATQTSKRSPIDYTAQWEALLNPLPPTQQYAQSKASANTVLLTTEWNQRDPYNHDCPTASGGPDGRAPAGCVNVALAQILRFWEHPEAVMSNHEYRDDEGSCTGTHSISDEGMGDYNWSDMRDSVFPTSSLDRRRAVGQLIFHIAVAMESNFESDVTGASSSDVPEVLREYFNFTCGDFVGKSSDSSEWFSKIRADIQADKPIYYVMRKPGSLGHALVCDGYSYNSNKEIHLNFGWSNESRNTWYNINSVSVNGYTWTWYGAVFDISPNQSELAFRGFAIDDDDSGGSDGNDDGIINSGEEIELSVSLRNTGDGTAHDVEGILSTSDRYVDITDEDVSWGDISAGTTDEASDFNFEIDRNCPAGREIDFTLEITADEGEWTEEFSIIVDGYPDLSYHSHRIDDDDDSGDSDGNDDGEVDPGEIIEMSVTLQNTGIGDASGVKADLSTSDPFISITDNYEIWGRISSGTREEEIDFDFEVADDCLVGRQVTFSLAIRSDEGSWDDSFQVSIIGKPALSISSTSINLPAVASSGRTIDVAANVSWTVTANHPWITITSGGTGAGNGKVTYNVAANTGGIRSGTITISGGGISNTFTVNQWPASTHPLVSAEGDFDGDFEADFATFQPATGIWKLLFIGYTQWTVPFGSKSMLPVPADYDGDGLSDIALYRPSNGTWYILFSAGGSKMKQFGWNKTVPVPGDYDGDGRTDLAIYYPNQVRWYFLYSGGSQGGDDSIQFGGRSDIPVPADYDGDGAMDMAVYRPSTGYWYILYSGGGYKVKQLGWSSTIPVPGDYDGDGRADIAVLTRNTSKWCITYSGGGSLIMAFGYKTMTPVQADYDGDGATDIAMYHEASGTWFIRESSTGRHRRLTYGGPGKIPVLLYPMIYSWFGLP